MDWIPDSFLIGADGVLWCFLGVGEIHSLRCTCRRMSHLVSKARPTSLICDMMCLIDKISMPTVWATLRTLRVSVDPKAGLRSLLCAIGHLPELSHLHVNHGRQFVDAVQHRVCDRGLADSVLDFGLPPFPRLQSLTIDLVTRRECLLIAQFWRTGCVMPNLQELSIDCSLVLDIREAPEVLVARITEGTHGLSLLRTLHIDASTMHRCDPVALLHTLSSPDTVQRLVLVLERITVANHRCQPRSVSHPTPPCQEPIDFTKPYHSHTWRRTGPARCSAVAHARPTGVALGPAWLWSCSCQSIGRIDHPSKHKWPGSRWLRWMEWTGMPTETAAARHQYLYQHCWHRHIVGSVHHPGVSTASGCCTPHMSRTLDSFLLPWVGDWWYSLICFE